MTDAAFPPPRHLLLATDLGARSDRACDRAIGLAREWGARLTVVHALEGGEIPTDRDEKSLYAEVEARAFAELRRGLSDAHDIPCELVVRRSSPADAVLDIAREKQCDLIVTGIAGRGPLGRSLLGTLTAHLAKRSPIPLLVVKRHGRRPYREAVVASDFSAASAGALDLAARLFDPSRLTLFHAFDMPYRGFVDDKRAYEEGQATAVAEEARTFLAARLGDAALEMGVRVAYGDPAPLLSDYVQDREVDLVIAGTHGRSGLISVLLGSVADALLEEVPCDMLMVPSPGLRSTP